MPTLLCRRQVFFASTLIAAVTLLAGCFHSADVSKIRCTESTYCPGGYVCVVEPGGLEGRCEKVLDGGGTASALDGAPAIDGAFGIDGARDVDGAYSLDGAVDQGTGGVDLALAGNADGAGTNLDIAAGIEVSPPDSLADMPLLSPDSSDASVADAPVDLAATEAAGKAGGAKCQSGTECASTYCVDGVCCDGACAGQCQACAEPNKVGTCTTVSGAPRGPRPACAATQTTCAGACGSLPDQCDYPGDETVCGGASCSGELEVRKASVCDGAGACSAGGVVSCGSGKYCTGGACVPQIANGGACLSGNQCTSGNCSNALCCSSTQTGCGGSCVSLSSSSSNCGSCGRSCAVGSTCSGGTCYLLDGRSCSTGGQCLSGVCGTFYVDSDGDGFGVGVGVGMCGTSSPSGYAKNASDCCDSDSTAYPGSTTTLSTPDACGSFDYNCDGNETPKSNGPTSCGGPPACTVISGTCTYVNGCTCGGSDPCSTYNAGSCGGSYTINALKCEFYQGVCGPLSAGGPYGTQACN